MNEEQLKGRLRKYDSWNPYDFNGVKKQQGGVKGKIELNGRTYPIVQKSSFN